MHAYIEVKGKQFKVEEGKEIQTPRLELEEGKTIDVSEVLLLRSDDDSQKIGSPYIKNAKVTLKVVSHGRSKKMLGAKFKRRKGYTKIFGSRTEFSLLQVQTISVE